MIGRTLLTACLLILSYAVQASIYALPIEGDVVGQIQYAHPEPGETLSDVGIRFDIGFHEMQRANPHVTPNGILSTHELLVIPSQYILPKVSRQGIIINLAEYRLYYYPNNDNVVLTFPVGIGRLGWSTPVGKTVVTQKQSNPSWRPTSNIKAHALKYGIRLPEEFPPNDTNPLGRYVLRLGWASYLIHGSNHKEGVGKRVSAGCIRLLPDDIAYLYDLVKVGTPVLVVHEPIKIGLLKDTWYVELHPPLPEKNGVNLKKELYDALASIKNIKINHSFINQQFQRPSGLPFKMATS